MNITVRLYRTHDYDLLQLYKNTGFPVKDAMHYALKKQVNGEAVQIDLPTTVIDADADLKSMQFHLKLDDLDDIDIIEYLNRIKKGYRNSFLKNILRGYMSAPAVTMYLSEQDIFEEDKEEEFSKSDKEHIKLKNVNKRRKEKREE